MDRTVIDEIFNLFEEFDKFVKANIDSEEFEPSCHPLHKNDLFKLYWQNQKECRLKLQEHLYLSEFSISKIQ